jgi:hypothetical protein
MAKVKKRKTLSKSEIKLAVYKPSANFFMEKLDAWTYKLHFTPKDASNSISSLSNKFEVENAGKGYHGCAYIVRHKL